MRRASVIRSPNPSPRRSRSLCRAPSRRRRHLAQGCARQRGASAILVAVLLFALLSALLAALDVGRLYFAQRELQKLANLAALDAARAVGGCHGAVADPAGTAAAAARASIGANDANVAILDHSLSAVELGVIQSVG